MGISHRMENTVTFAVNADGMIDFYIQDLGTGKDTKLPLRAGLNSFGGAESAFSHDGIEASLLPQWPERAE